MRLESFVSKKTSLGRQGARRAVASGRVRVAGQVITDPKFEVGSFVTICLDGIHLQCGEARYLMLHKPAGYLSATRDPVHPTVLELIPAEPGIELHIGGRLDRATTGLLILTNDGRWSRCLTEPGRKIPKVYRVRTAEPIAACAETRFAAGIPLVREGITTSPAGLERLGPCEARLTIHEGRHHQVKRMFAQVGNQVVALHRERMGEIILDDALSPGQFRPLTAAEIASVPLWHS